MFTSSGNSLLLSLNGRVTHIDLLHSRSRTLPFEATANLQTLALHPHGNSLFAVDKNSRTSLLSLPSGRVLAHLSLRLSPVHTAAFSPCGGYVAFADSKLTEIWRVPDAVVPNYAAFDRHMRVAGGAYARGSMQWSPDGKSLAVGGADGIVKVFEVGRKREEGVRVIPLVLHGHRQGVVFVAFVGKRGLITLSEDGVLFCWRLRRREEESGTDKRIVVPLEAKLMSRHFVKAGGGRRVYCASVHMGVFCVGMSNGVFALYQLDDQMVQENQDIDTGLFELAENRKRKAARKKEEEEQRKKKKGDGNGDEKGPSKVDEDNDEDEEDKGMLRVGFTDLTTLHTLSAAKAAITDILFNPTGEWIALASSQSGQLVVWEWRSETHILKQQSHSLSATAVAFSPDGRAIATGSTDGRVKLWGVTNGFCIATFSNHNASVSAVTFAKNDVILSSSLDGSVRAFDTKRYRNFRTMVGPPPRRQFGSVACDLAGEIVAAGCVDTFEVCVWSLRTGQILELLNGHTGPVSEIAFRPSRGTLATSSWDRTVRLWDMYERKGSCEALEHSKEVLSVAFRPDGKEFASCTTSGEIQLWDPERGVVTGSIDGARDAAAGRLKDSRTVAQQKGYFQTLSYSADGRFLLAGAASKHVCIYYVEQGSRPALIAKVPVTRNQSFDGLLDRLNTKNLTAGGDVRDLIDDDDFEAIDYGVDRIADRTSLPGATSEAKLRRKKLLKAEVQCVASCPTGRLWAAVTTEGVLVYGESHGDGIDEMGEMLFDPKNLNVDVTPESALKAANEKDYLTGLTMALRLNELDCLNKVVEKIPDSDISVVVGDLPLLYFTRLATLFAWRLDNTPHLEYNLKWARRLLLTHGADAHESTSDPSTVNTALTALFKSTNAHAKRLVSLADGNQYMLKFLHTYATKVIPRQIEEEKESTAIKVE